MNIEHAAKAVKLGLRCAIPATSCSAEWSLSTTRRLRRNLLSTMGQDHLSHLAVTKIERLHANAVTENCINSSHFQSQAHMQRPCS